MANKLWAPDPSPQRRVETLANIDGKAKIEAIPIRCGIRRIGREVGPPCSMQCHRGQTFDHGAIDSAYVATAPSLPCYPQRQKLLRALHSQSGRLAKGE